MKSTFSLTSSLAVACLIATSHSHTWLEDIRLIASNGTFIGPVGYPRGYVSRGPGVTVDTLSQWQINPGNIKTATMCRPEQQGIGKQTEGFPAIQAASSDNIALRYKENGHVTILNQARPARSGTVYIYGTKDPKEQEKFGEIHQVWNAAGTGGDKRGKLIATRPYDDGQCYQVNGNDLSNARRKALPDPSGDADLVCQVDIQVPTDAGTSGLYTIYYVWDWTLLQGAPTIEMYTACADIKLTAKTNTDVGPFIAKQAFNMGAIKEQLTNQFMMNPTSPPSTVTAPPFNMGPGSPSSAAPVVSSPSKQTSAAPSPSSSPVTVSTSAALPSTTPAKSSTSTPKSSTTTSPSFSSPPAQGFITVTVTVTPEGQKAPATITEYVTLSTSIPGTTTLRKTVTSSLIPLPADSFIGSRSSSASQKPEPTPVGGRPVVEPIFSASPSASPTAPGGVFREPNASSSTTSDAVVHSSASTTSDAVAVPTAPVNGTAPLVGRHTRKRSSRIARW